MSKHDAPKAVKKIWFTKDPDGSQDFIEAKDGRVMQEEFQNMGDYGLIFVCIYDNEGKLQSKWNVRYLEGIEYGTDVKKE